MWWLPLLALAAGDARAESDLSFDLEGYYRTRGHAFPGFFEEQEGNGAFMLHSLRLRPVVAREDARFMVQVDALRDVLWGDNTSRAATALFAGDPSTTTLEGTEGAAIQLTRAWMEFPVPVGLVRVGRQPSHWGMGLLANAGDGFDDTFGENHYGATYDRVIFATRPLAVAQGILGKEDSGLPLYVAVGVDRLVEDPLFQFWGYSCTPGLSEGDRGFDARCDDDGDGVTDASHPLVDETRTGADRGADWWADPADDVWEMIYVLTFKGEDMEFGGRPATVVAGVYGVHRLQEETDSNVLILDGYLKLQLLDALVEGEVLHIGGDTRAIALPGTYDPSGLTEDPLLKRADIWGYVTRLGYTLGPVTPVIEHGFASGDDNVADADFTGRPLHPDFNVGLLLYEEILARVTAATWSEAAEGLWSNGGVTNSRYLFPTIHFVPREGTEIIAAYLVAWPDRPDGSRILCAKGDGVECAEYKATAATLGWEADLAVKQRWKEHLLFSLEGGYARITDRIPVEQADLDPSRRYLTVQGRMAFEF